MTISKARKISVVNHSVIICLDNMLVNDTPNQIISLSSILTRQFPN